MLACCSAQCSSKPIFHDGDFARACLRLASSAIFLQQGVFGPPFGKVRGFQPSLLSPSLPAAGAPRRPIISTASALHLLFYLFFVRELFFPRRASVLDGSRYSTVLPSSLPYPLPHPPRSFCRLLEFAGEEVEALLPPPPTPFFFRPRTGDGTQSLHGLIFPLAGPSDPAAT